MPKKTHITKNNPDKYITSNKSKNNFMVGIINGCALACSNPRRDFNADHAIQDSKDGLAALETPDAVKTMLSAQMLAINNLLLTSVFLANSSSNLNLMLKQYYTNTSIKLANTFVQQANLLAKLQGIGNQPINVGRVDIHEGGQAVVGNINGYQPK